MRHGSSLSTSALASPEPGPFLFWTADPFWQGSCDSFLKSMGLVLIAASPDHLEHANETPTSF
jgi:hypothetical protein